MSKDELKKLVDRLYDRRDYSVRHPHEPQEELVRVRELIHAEVDKRKNEL